MENTTQKQELTTAQLSKLKLFKDALRAVDQEKARERKEDCFAQRDVASMRDELQSDPATRGHMSDVIKEYCYNGVFAW